MGIPSDGKEQYVRAYSHRKLAKDWGMSLNTLQEYAQESGWDGEHRLYWQDVALEALKQKVEEQEVSAIKELLKATGVIRPVGRPPKSEVQRHIAIEAKVAKEYEDDLTRMRLVRP
jgi:hypothetical protein